MPRTSGWLLSPASARSVLAVDCGSVSLCLQGGSGVSFQTATSVRTARSRAGPDGGFAGHWGEIFSTAAASD